MKGGYLYNMSEKDLFLKRENGFIDVTEEEKREIFEFSEEYRKCISECKTEREFAAEAKRLLEKNGFLPIDSLKSVKSGDKVYQINRGKGVCGGCWGSTDYRRT